MKGRDFLDLIDIPTQDLRGMIEASRAMKARRERAARPLEGRTLAMIFDKPSTRTRVSFDVVRTAVEHVRRKGFRRIYGHARQGVGEDLAGMRASREAVDHRHGGVPRELGQHVVIERADHDDIDIT